MHFLHGLKWVPSPPLGFRTGLQVMWPIRFCFRQCHQHRDPVLTLLLEPGVTSSLAAGVTNGAPAACLLFLWNFHHKLPPHVPLGRHFLCLSPDIFPLIKNYHAVCLFSHLGIKNAIKFFVD